MMQQSAGDGSGDGSDVDDELLEWEVVTLEVEGNEVEYYFIGVAHDILDDRGVAVFFERTSFDEGEADLVWTFLGFDDSAEGDDRFSPLEDPNGVINAGVVEWIGRYLSDDTESELILFTDKDGDEHVSLGVFDFEDGTWLAACDEDDVDNEPEDRLYYFYRVDEDGNLTYDETIDASLTDTYVQALEDDTVTPVTFDDGKVVFPTNAEAAVADEQDEIPDNDESE